MQILDLLFVVITTLWCAGVFFGLILPDKTSKKVLNWVAEVEHQPLWWLPVGLGSLILFVYGLFRSINIQVDWLVLSRAAFFLIGVVIFALIWFFSYRRNRNSNSESLEVKNE
jgi:ABC-type molybdate transport system permease subunit